MNLRLWEDGVDQVIDLPHGGPGADFRLSDLVNHVRGSGRDYIIQGQRNCTLEAHSKPQSLDVWLRQGYTDRKNTKKAVNRVVDALVATGQFEVDRLPCPDSGRMCKGLKLALP